jgi:hypothetical protein
MTPSSEHLSVRQINTSVKESFKMRTIGCWPELLTRQAPSTPRNFLSVEEKHERNALIEQQEKNRERELGLPDEVLWVHGVAPASKGKGIIWLIYKNMNGISNRMSDNDKLKKSRGVT